MAVTPEAGPLVFVVRRDLAELLFTEAFRRYERIETVVDRRRGERRARREPYAVEQRRQPDRRVRGWLSAALATDGAVLVRR